MLHAIEQALDSGYAVGVLNPNTNSVVLRGKLERVPIPNSYSPEVCLAPIIVIPHMRISGPRTACLGFFDSPSAILRSFE